MAIMVLITATLLVRQSKFDSSTLLRSLTYSVALSVRQAQVYSTSVLGTTTTQAACGGNYSAGTCFASAYGIHLVAGNQSSYTLFADLNGDGKYNAGEDVKVFTLGNGYSISDFCAITTGDSPITRCASQGTANSLDIYFKRPNPDALFYNSSVSSEQYIKAYIQIQFSGDTGSMRNVCVYVTGQIAVEPLNTVCP